jgi:hypothetical protein
MSENINVFIKDVRKIKKRECERYMSDYGMKINICPGWDFVNESGFMPFKLTKGNRVFRSGFEYFADEYEHDESEYDEGVSTEDHEFLASCKYVITLAIYGDEKYFLRTAYAFAGYLIDVLHGAMFEVTGDDYGTLIKENAKPALLKEILEYEEQEPDENAEPFECWDHYV